MPKSSTSAAHAPLSSLRFIPATAETVARLRELGLSAEGLTEFGAQNLLAVHDSVLGEEEAHPPCYQSRFNPADTLCQGCVFAPRCWRSDLGYLHRLGDGHVEPPAGVPPQVVAERVAHAATRKAKAPPVPKKAPPPVESPVKKAPPLPPPRRKR